ncbi:MAG: spheroidene monooxygenase, partial [Actinomycetota bacterium]|nr:spheroidene monooxygenase [Actinomycetota bacterium]
WRADLRPLRSRGRWSGREPFGALATAGGGSVPGPVAAVTRARLRLATMRVFWRAVPPVSADANARDGLLFAVGFGEAPVGVQGTFSVWADQNRLDRFAYGGAAHRAAIHDTHRRRWYSEELFARFEVMATTGTVRGRDPLAPG